MTTRTKRNTRILIPAGTKVLIKDAIPGAVQGLDDKAECLGEFYAILTESVEVTMGSSVTIESASKKEAST